MKQSKLDLLADKFFLLGLFCLLANDLVLKYLIGGFVTGKLSDVAGLFIFPFFWSIFFARQKLGIYMATILIFTIWKTPVSTDVIHWTNERLGTGFGRVVDYTDLVTLLVIPVSYRHFVRKIEVNNDKRFDLRIAPILIVGVSLFAFVATTLPSKEVKTDLHIGESYIINVEKEEIFRNRIKPARGLSASHIINMTDSLFFLEFGIDGHDLMAKVKIYKTDEARTTIEFISLTSYTVTGGLFSGFDEEKLQEMKNLTVDDYKTLFESGVIEPIKAKNRSEPDIFYWNPNLDPIILDRN